MRVLVVGGSGLVGSHVLREARSRGHDAVGTSRSSRPDADPRLERFDAAHPGDFLRLLEVHHPDIVIHAAGWTWVDGCEEDPDRAMEENCCQPADLAAACAARGVRFVYVSTSYVFDGTRGPYEEFDEPGPEAALGAYARSKLAGERAVTRAAGDGALVVRVIWVYGEDIARKNFACQVCDAMTAGRVLHVPSDQRGNPTWAGDIARVLVFLLENGEVGVWHLGGADPDCDRVEWARRLVASFEAVGVPARPGFAIADAPTAELGQKAPRPLRAGIVSRRLPEPTMAYAGGEEVFRRIARGAS